MVIKGCRVVRSLAIVCAGVLPGIFTYGLFAQPEPIRMCEFRYTNVQFPSSPCAAVVGKCFCSPTPCGSCPENPDTWLSSTSCGSITWVPSGCCVIGDPDHVSQDCQGLQ